MKRRNTLMAAIGALLPTVPYAFPAMPAPVYRTYPGISGEWEKTAALPHFEINLKAEEVIDIKLPTDALNAAVLCGLLRYSRELDTYLLTDKGEEAMTRMLHGDTTWWPETRP